MDVDVVDAAEVVVAVADDIVFAAVVVADELVLWVVAEATEEVVVMWC